MGVLAAVMAAKASGRGQGVDCAMCDGAASLMSTFYQMFASSRGSDRREANIIDGGAHFYGVFGWNRRQRRGD
jgi:alpha-methylacyl-CoA racemase